MKERRGDDILYDHQRDAVNSLCTGSILVGGVGTGKSLTALVYFFEKVCKGMFRNKKAKTPWSPRPLYIITTARKRDTDEWLDECKKIGLDAFNETVIPITIDSWNNIKKYEGIEHAFFIFDEQRVIGSGTWARSFIKIAKRNEWILLSATPGDRWIDYVPVFIANGFYKTRGEFMRRHVIFSRFAKYPKIEKYTDVTTLERHRRAITVHMEYQKKTIPVWKTVYTSYSKELMKRVFKDRWNPYENKPIQDISGVCYLMQRVSTDDASRYEALLDILEEHKKAIVFYNYNYELEALRHLANLGHTVAEWNGQKHEPIPDSDEWVYLVQYTAGAEGWNCIETDTMIFHSQNYSYRIMSQASGRIDRLNTPFEKLYYYILRTDSEIDNAIAKAVEEKRVFNETLFMKHAQ